MTEKERLAQMLREFPSWGHAALHYQDEAERLREKGALFLAADDALEHRPRRPDDEHRHAWVYTDGTLYTVDEHSRRLDAVDRARAAFREALS